MNTASSQFIAAVQKAKPGLTGTELCRRAGLSPSVWSEFLAGNRQLSAGSATAIAAVAGLRLGKGSELEAYRKGRQPVESTVRIVKSVSITDEALSQYANEQAKVRHGGNFSRYIKHLIEADRTFREAAYGKGGEP